MSTNTQTQTWNGSPSTSTSAPSRALTVATWVLSVAAAAMFAMAGFGKLSGDPQMVGLFDVIGIGQWFRYVTGAIELLGGIALLIPAAAFFAALALSATMIGAVLTHLVVLHNSPAIPAVLLLVTAFIAWSRGSRR